jgi:hypothetical protein
MSEIHSDHPIRAFFAEALRTTLREDLGEDDLRIEAYLQRLLIDFMNWDGIYSIRDGEGRRVQSVSEMLEYGDVRLKANSFDREREVHRHVGDFLLFWSGLFPEALRGIKGPVGPDALLDPVGQGRHSYYVASTFSHDRYAEESGILRHLSDEFERYQFGMQCLRSRLPSLA